MHDSLSPTYRATFEESLNLSQPQCPHLQNRDHPLFFPSSLQQIVHQQKRPELLSGRTGSVDYKPQQQWEKSKGSLRIQEEYLKLTWKGRAFWRKGLQDTPHTPTPDG